MQIDKRQLDVHVFTSMVADAETWVQRGRLTEGAELLQQALQLWRGQALSGMTSQRLLAVAAQLNERRLAVLESRIDLDLQLGREAKLVGEFSALVAMHPLRERLRGQLMLALYRAGRRSEALDAYRTGRALLVDQIGLEPGEELRQLEAAILAGDASLRWSAGHRTGGEHAHAEVTAAPPPPEDEHDADPVAMVPFQLPTDIADFSCREEPLDQVERELLAEQGGSATRVVVLTGKPGVGKSALAVHAAHRLEERFPDGQLYRDLGGTSARPATVSDVLGRFLRAMGVPGATIPDDVDERAEIYRNLSAHKRMLVLLDDAFTESQVRQLLPGSGSCAVIITSRARLTGLPGARVLDLDVFDNDQSVRMLATASRRGGGWRMRRQSCGGSRMRSAPGSARTLVPSSPALDDHPKNVYLPESAVLEPLNEWIGGLFDPTNVDRTVAALVASQDTTQRQQPREVLQARLTDAETRLRRLTDAVAAGADPAAFVDAINNAQAQREAARAELDGARPSDALSEAEIYAMINYLGDIGTAIGDATPERLQALYESLRLEMTYEHKEEAVFATIRPGRRDCAGVRGATCALTTRLQLPSNVT